MFLIGNDTLEELNVADNADLDKESTLTTANVSSGPLLANPNSFSSLEGDISEKADNDQQESCLMTDCNQLEVADSEDDEVREEQAASDFDNSSCEKKSSQCQFIQELSTAIGMAKHLRVLNLSNNGITTEAIEALYLSWSSRLGVDQPKRHIEDKIIHFTAQGSKCCSVKPCCRRH